MIAVYSFLSKNLDIQEDEYQFELPLDYFDNLVLNFGDISSSFIYK